MAMSKLYRILGKRGRITIPYEMRRRVGFSYNDVLSFTEQDDRTVVVRREKICDNCCSSSKQPENAEKEGVTLMQFLDGLSADEQRAAVLVVVHDLFDLFEGEVEFVFLFADVVAKAVEVVDCCVKELAEFRV